MSTELLIPTNGRRNRDGKLPETGGTARFFVTPPEPVWSDLGTALKPGASIEQAMQDAQMDWEVEKVPLFVREHGATDPDAYSQVEDKRAIVRADDGAYLGVVGSSFETIQNREPFDIIGAMSDEGVEFCKAGVMKGGRLIWCIGKMPSSLCVGDEQGERYVIAITAHDGSRSLGIVPTTNMPWCGNQIEGIEAAGSGAKFRHTSRVRERIGVAIEMFRSADARLDKLGAFLNAMRGVRLTKPKVLAYMKKVAERGRNTAENDTFARVLMDRYENGAGQDKRGKNAWAALCAVTDTVDHVIRPNEEERPSIAKQERRMFRTTFGAGAATKRRAMSIAAEMFGNAKSKQALRASEA